MYKYIFTGNYYVDCHDQRRLNLASAHKSVSLATMVSWAHKYQESEEVTATLVFPVHFKVNIFFYFKYTVQSIQ
jgi:hypothetical protein